MGIGTTVDRLKGRAYFPKMKAEVEDYIRSCSVCQKKVRKTGDQRHTLVSPTAGYPFQRLHVDLVGPLNETSRSWAKYILTCKDAFSKWPEAFALKDIDALTIVRTLEKEIFARYGYPDTIHSDQGPQFMAKLFKQLQPQLGIKVTDTTGYNPKGNGQVERMHRDLGGILRALTTECGDPFTWEDLLPQALFALRTAVCKSTGLAPYQILFGRECSTPIDSIFGFVPPERALGSLGWEQYYQKLKKRIGSAQEYARKHLTLAVKRQRRQYHQERKDFKPGTKVWLFTPITNKNTSRKLTPYWTGPWRVCAEPARYETMVRITPDPSWKDGSKRGTHVVSIDRLKLYHRNTALIPNQGADIEMSDDEFTEHLRLTRNSDQRGSQDKGIGGEEKRERKGDDSEDDMEGPKPPFPQEPATGRPERNAPSPRATHGTRPKTPRPRDQRRPSTPLTRAQAAIRRALAQVRQGQTANTSPPTTRAQAAKKRACPEAPQPTPRTARPDPGLGPQPRVVLSPIDIRAHTQSPVPPDMANYYRNYKSPGRGKTWGPTNKHPPKRPHVNYPDFPPHSSLADGQGPLPKPRRSPWHPPNINLSCNTPPQLRSLPDVSMESLSGLDAFKPRQYEEPPILEGDAPSYESSSPSDYQEASALDPDYVPDEEDADMNDS